MTTAKILEPKPLKYKTVEGLTEKQLAEHHDVLYAGYVKKYNEIAAALTTVDLTTANGTYSALRELKIEQGFALNALKLHEAYFDNLTDSPTLIDEKLKARIAERWGSYEAWADEFAALGLCSRGWVALVWDYSLDGLENYIFDAHHQGSIADTEMVLILDVYEHAYFIDYATARKTYIEKFMAAIDWEVVKTRVSSHL